MDGDEGSDPLRRSERLPAYCVQRDAAPEQRAGRRDPKANHRPRLDQQELLLEPGTTRFYFSLIRPLVDPSLPSPFVRLPLEVLDDVRHVDPAPINACGTESSVE